MAGNGPSCRSGRSGAVVPDIRPTSPRRRRPFRRAARRCSPRSCAACGTRPPAATPSADLAAVDFAPSTAAPTARPDPAAVYAEIEAQVQTIRELKAEDARRARRCSTTRRSRRTWPRASPRTTRPRVIAATQRLYELARPRSGRHLASRPLARAAGQPGRRLLRPRRRASCSWSSQTGRPRADREVRLRPRVRPRAPGPELRAEDSASSRSTRAIASLARLALAEGDATLLMTLWAQQRPDAGRAARVPSRSRATRTQQAILDEMPRDPRETLLFPYSSGLELVSAPRPRAAGRRSTRCYAKPPDSTEQILHPDKYAAGEAPVAVAFPKDLATRLGTGWSVAMPGHPRRAPARGLAAAARRGPARRPRRPPPQGWGGDRVALVRTADRAGVAIDTALGHAGRRGGVRRGRADGSRTRSAARTGDDRRRGTDRSTVFIATDDADDARGLARPSVWPASRPALHLLGRRDPEQRRARSPA